MLLNTKITIEVTNDGVKNEACARVEMNHSLKDVMTSFKLAESGLMTTINALVRSKFAKPPTEKQIDKFLSNTTMEDMFNFTQKKASENIKG
jgi:hypothetical protein